MDFPITFFAYDYEFALDPAKEYLIIQWDDNSGEYLVASRDPDVTSEEILEYFQGFIEWYAYD